MGHRIEIAKITTAHGIKGFVKLKVFAENPKDIEKYNPLFISEKSDKAITIKLKNAIKGGWVAEVEGITDRNDAEELRNTPLYIEEDDLAESDDKILSNMTLISMDVLDNNKNVFGKVLSVQNYGAGDLLEIKPHDGNIFFFPLNKDTCPIIDKQAKTIQTVDIQEFIF